MFKTRLAERESYERNGWMPKATAAGACAMRSFLENCRIDVSIRNARSILDEHFPGSDPELRDKAVRLFLYD